MYEVSGRCVHPLCSTGIEHRRTRRRTVGTVAELQLFLSKEFLESSFPRCPDCHRPIARRRFVVWDVQYDNGNEVRRERLTQQSTGRGPRLDFLKLISSTAHAGYRQC